MTEIREEINHLTKAQNYWEWEINNSVCNITFSNFFLCVFQWRTSLVITWLTYSRTGHVVWHLFLRFFCQAIRTDLKSTANVHWSEWWITREEIRRAESLTIHSSSWHDSSRFLQVEFSAAGWEQQLDKHRNGRSAVKDALSLCVILTRPQLCWSYSATRVTLSQNVFQSNTSHWVHVKL